MSEPTSSTPHTPIRTSQSSSNTKIPPPHLSEFYSFVNNNNTNNHHHHNNNHVLQSPMSTTTTATTSSSGNDDRILNPSFISTSSNISYAESDNEFELRNLIVTLRDISKIISRYEKVIIKAINYEKLLIEISKLSSEFGESIEQLTKLKGSDEVGEDFIKSSGLQFVNSNYELILLQILEKNFIQPLKEKLEIFKNYQNTKNSSFQKLIITKMKHLKLREQELQMFNKQKKKKLDINKYKSNLIAITNELDNIEQFKKLNYQETLSNLRKFHSEVLDNLTIIIRLQLEINETILKKSWSGGGLDELISKCPDPFNEDEEDITLNNITEIEDEEDEE